MFNILKTRSFRISNALLLNDSKETQWIKTHFEDIKNIEDVLKIYKNNDFIPYIGCFSEKGDLLSQWRGYADDGKGVSICFDFNQIEIKKQIPWMAVEEKLSLGIEKIIYKKKEQSQLIEDLINQAFKRIENNTKRESTEKLTLALELKKLSLVMKNPCFEEENEWRIMYAPMIMDNQIISHEQETKKQLLSDIKFRICNGTLISYFELNFGNIFTSDFIPSITLGPKSNIEVNEMYKYLAVNGLLNTEIFESDASYQ